MPSDENTDTIPIETQTCLKKIKNRNSSIFIPQHFTSKIR